MKKVVLVIAVLSTGTAAAQSLTPDAIASSGSTFSDGTSQLDWTLGEPATFTFTAGSTILTQGFHQPNLLITALSDAAEEVSLTVFPNPVIDQVQLQFGLEKENVTVELLSADGKLLSSQNAVHVKNLSVDMETCVAGTYLLSVKDKHSKTRTYRIIKLK